LGILGFGLARGTVGVVHLEEQHERLPQLALLVGAGAGSLAVGVVGCGNLDDLGVGGAADGGEALHEAGGADAGEGLGRVPAAPP
jgi:hypothetical protein